MTTLQAIRLLAEQIELGYETIDEFQPSKYDAEMELMNGRHCIDISYKDAGEGEVSDIRFTFLKKYFSGKWVNIGGIMDVNEALISDTFKKLMKEQYSQKLREYNEEHAAEIAETEREFYKEMYYDNKMCLALGK